jgi:hypothetical protein
MTRWPKRFDWIKFEIEGLDVFCSHTADGKWKLLQTRYQKLFEVACVAQGLSNLTAQGL